MYMKQHWKDDMEKKVNDALNGFIRWEKGSYPDTSEKYYTYRTSINRNKLDNADIVIGYNENIKLYVVWNVLLHKKHFKEDKNTYSFAVKLKKEDIKEIQNSTKSIFSFYRKPNNFEMYEKVVVMNEGFLLDFCNDPFGYLMPNLNDKGYEKNTIFANPDSPEPILISEFEKSNKYQTEIVRKRYSVERTSRDTHFREKVFSKYNPPHCIICGTKIKSILEAAHIKAVKDNGNDSSENGICLCCNHHKMFDDNLIDIDTKHKYFSVNDRETAIENNYTLAKKYDIII